MTTEPEAKKMRTLGPRKLIGTHDGTFHCDEALAVFLLRQTTLYHDADLVRTRDPDKLNQCTVVVDVGAVYDEKSQRFDHHQRGFEEVFGHGFMTKLSSAGLIYKHFGQEIIRTRLKTTSDDPRILTLYLKMYKELIEGIDGIDNGVPQYPPDIKPAYSVRTDLSSRVGWLNPAWNESTNQEVVDKQFGCASRLAGEEFCQRLDYYTNAWLPARNIVLSAVQGRTSIESNGRVVVLEEFAPWKEHLFDIEKELSIQGDGQLIYVLYPDGTSGQWRIQAVPLNTESFLSRKALPEGWRGLRDDELSQKSGVPGCIFVHSSGFIGGNKSKDGALAMAMKALQI